MTFFPQGDHSPGLAFRHTHSQPGLGSQSTFQGPDRSAGCCSPLLRRGNALGRAGKVPESSHAGAAVCLLVPGGLRLGRLGGLRCQLRGPRGAEQRHARHSDGDPGGDGPAAGGLHALRGLPGAAVRQSGRRPAPGDRPRAVPAAGARGPARRLLRPEGLPDGAQQLQPRHPRAPVRGHDAGLRGHRAALQPAGRAAPAAPGRLRQLRGARRRPLEVPARPGRLAQRPALHRGPRRGGARGRGRPGARRQRGQRAERQRGAPAGLLRGGAVRARALGAPGAGAPAAQGEQEAAAGEQGGLSASARPSVRCPDTPPSSPRSPPCAPRPCPTVIFSLFFQRHPLP